MGLFDGKSPVSGRRVWITCSHCKAERQLSVSHVLFDLQGGRLGFTCPDCGGWTLKHLAPGEEALLSGTQAPRCRLEPATRRDVAGGRPWHADEVLDDLAALNDDQALARLLEAR